mgnify:CR=1 FL=1
MEGAEPKEETPRPDIKRAWERLTKAASLEGITFHDLRRSFGKELNRAAGLRVAQEALGHSTPDQTAAAYTPEGFEAVKEAVRQIRLRDLGGIIVVDFMDMRLESHRRKVYEELKKAFRKDRAVTKLLPMSDFGLVEITRQRLRPSRNPVAQKPVFTTVTGDAQFGQA